MKSCEYYQALISRLLDGDLSPAELAELDGHVRACPDCRAMLDVFSDVSQALQNDMAEPPAELASVVMERIRADEKAAETIPLSAARQKRRTPWRWLAVAACLVVIVGSGAVFALQGKGGMSGASDSAAPMAMAQEYSRSVDAGAVYESAEAAYDMDDAFESAEAEEAVMEMPAGAAIDMEPAEIPLPEPEAQAVAEDIAADDSASLPVVYDPDGNYVGFIEDMDALAELLTEADPGPDGLPPVDWDTICTVKYGGVTYAFGTDSNLEYLVWWDMSEAGVSRSPGTVADLDALIIP